MTDGPQAQNDEDLPTQRLPGRGEPGISSEEAANLAEHLLEPTVPGGAGRGVPSGPGRSTPPTQPLGTEEVSQSQPAPRPGARSASRPVLGDRYELLDELGRGGMGVVYRAHDRTLGRDVALKVLQVAGRVDAETIGRFQREARAAAALDHPNIVRVHDVGVLPDGAPYYTMEMLAGHDLAHAIADGQVSPKEAVEAVRQVSLALFYAHQKGILHRDLKPQNIFLRRAPTVHSAPDAPTVNVAGLPCTGDPKGRPSLDVHALLLDFGLAKLADRDLQAHAEGSQGRKSMQSLTRSGEVFGTPMYMPPEQTHGAKDVDARADIYSLGAALYHALAARPMFDAGSLAELLVKVQRQDPPPPSQFNADVDADLDTLTLKCLQKDPKDRYQNAGELAEDLKSWLTGDPISARPIGLAGRVWRKAKRNKAVAIPVAALSVVILLGLLGWAGIEVNKRVQFARQTADAERALAAAEEAGQPVGGPDYARARVLALAASVLYPEDKGVKSLLARICLSQGKRARGEYEGWKRKVDELEAQEEEAQVLEAAKDDDERRARREAAWTRGSDMKDARRARGETIGAALVQFQEALVYVQGHAEAERRLAELYWDEYLRAEKARDRSEEKRCEALVTRFGHAEYAAKVRGERDVKVAFHLPSDFQGTEVSAHLFRYELCPKPPILLPVPCDPKDQQAGSASGRLLADVSALAPAESEWMPVPLAEVGTPSRVDRVRWGSIYRLDARADNHVALPVESGVARLALRLPKGSYLLYIAAGQSLYETRYPFEVARDYAWDEACELVADEAPPLPPGTGSLHAPHSTLYWSYVPAGPYRASGDRDAQQSPPRPPAVIRVPEGKRLSEVAERDTTGVWIAHFEVTCEMYLDYLNDREWHKGCKPWDHVPRKAMDAMEQTTYWPRDTGAPSGPGRFSMPAEWEGWPILAVSWNDATDYCKWLTAQRGGADWRFELPTEDEWERAARGPDGRFFPWGDSIDATFCRMQDSRPDEKDLQPERFGLFPLDEGPFGVRDLAGGMREATSTTAGARGQWRVFKGGAWSGPSSLCRGAIRRRPRERARGPRLSGGGAEGPSLALCPLRSCPLSVSGCDRHDG